jgi:hypothetical protein
MPLSWVNIHYPGKPCVNLRRRPSADQVPASAGQVTSATSIRRDEDAADSSRDTQVLATMSR